METRCQKFFVLQRGTKEEGDRFTSSNTLGHPGVLRSSDKGFSGTSLFDGGLILKVSTR